MNTLYSTQVTATGGREGRARSIDGSLEVSLSLPRELGGPGKSGTTNPEQLFGAGYAACFESAVKTVSRRMKLDPGETAIDAKVFLVTGEDRSFNVAAQLDVSLPGLEDDTALDVVRAAHGVCPYSNATRGNIDVTLTANGRPVD